jgi:hypothetical protein
VPTHEELARFLRDFERLSAELRGRFLAALPLFRADLERGVFRPGFRVKRVRVVAGEFAVWEMSFAPDGRATFHYGPEKLAGHPHVVWRRVGKHEIFRDP